MSIDWIETARLLPKGKKPVFLVKSKEETISDADLGYLVVNENGDKGWFIDNDLKVLKIGERVYWTYLEEQNHFVPKVKDEELGQTVVQFLGRLALFERKFIRLGFWMIKSGKGTYTLDYFISGILSRALSLIYGFETLIQTKNFIGAAHLVRPHLDNFLRLYAAWLTNEPHEFAKMVWAGKPVSSLRDRNNKLMKDWYLKEKATEEYPWIKNVYEETSGFIHFSNKHIARATTVSEEKEMTLRTFIGKTDNNVSNQSKLEAIMGMIEISNCIANYIFGWIDTKRIKG